MLHLIHTCIIDRITLAQCHGRQNVFSFFTKKLGELLSRERQRVMMTTNLITIVVKYATIVS